MHKYSLNIFRKNINILLKLTLAVCCLGVVTPSLQLALGGEGVKFHFRCCRENKNQPLYVKYQENMVYKWCLDI